jgi:hypothetical protein
MASNRVNPPKQLVNPQEVQNNVPLKKALDDRDYILNQMWKRMGGGADWVDESREISYEFDDLLPLLSAFLPNKPDVISTSINHTSSGSQVVICNSALTVFLNEYPEDRETVKVIITNGDVIVSGNGKLINKDTEQTVIFKNLITTAALDIVYILETDEWFII